METNKNYQILVVDDEPLIRESLYEILRIEGYRVQMASTGESALEKLKEDNFDIILTDLKLPKMSGLDLLRKVKEYKWDTELILITGYGSIESAVEAMKEGAYDYITKPINDGEIKIIMTKILEKRSIIKENKDLKAIIAKEQRQSFCDLIGASPSMQDVYRVIDSVASSNATILISGESGTGKSMVAKAIHQSDKNRCGNPFIEVSCGALSETLLESELFGHVKGAFTGAIKDKEGRFEAAGNGTVFLDEIDAFSPNLQVKLLRVLQDGVYERVGDNVSRKTKARIIVATNQILTELVESGDFREDLYYRINVISIRMPSLRERKDDIEMITEYFVKKYAAANNKNITGISNGVKDLFLQYSWPGNIRELENAIEGAVIMSKGVVIEKDDFPNADRFLANKHTAKNVNSSEQPLKKVVEQPEKEHILSVLQQCNWNRNKAALVLGINRTTLYNKMKKYDIFDNEPQ
ncbi:MAG: sigma-54-dependent Fis family transcriptional regulator [Candidatus Omnitrophica bacterium]|nr:sigma-54-dependent Fis family transcriptional regulator [Candidatus Omnitrophota bacterium]MCB9747005.1 sigma-54-dependent Fis family transcriptional regulator [Candidatus Omnitrophota bacterium]